MTQVQDQDPELCLVAPHTNGLGPSIQPIQRPPTLQQINTPALLGIICKMTEGAVYPLVKITDKDTQQGWPQLWALRNTACDWPHTGCHSALWAPSSGQISYPANSKQCRILWESVLKSLPDAHGICLKWPHTLFVRESKNVILWSLMKKWKAGQQTESIEMFTY